MKLDETKAALEAIAARDGTLKPATVVEEARDPESPLHRHFNWDDTEAAQSYRLIQAGVLIRRIKVMVAPRDGGVPVRVRALVSLESDRGHDGYRSVEAVLGNTDLTRSMVATALGEFAALRRKYRDLAELSPLFGEIDRLLAASASRKQRDDAAQAAE
jgi:hypothetical protein